MKTFRAGRYINQGYFKSFQPNLVNREWQLDNMELIDLLSQADRQLGRLDMYSEYIPNIDLFISMHVVKEATQSSKIEGTQTGIEEVLRSRESVIPEKRDDWEEVQNYITALNNSIDALKKLPFSSRLIRNAHGLLMQGVRGQHKHPGEFRTGQNWIGGATINDALFIPPIRESVPELMSDLEHFIHNEKIHVPHLIKIAIAHYQFETIHPFLDGNGRVGRLMITLYLVSKNILKRPVLYLSDFFERHRNIYYDNLMRVRQQNDMDQWVKFFLTGVVETAKNGIRTFDKILQLQKQVDKDLQSLGRRTGTAQKVLQHLYENPFISAEEAGKAAAVSMPTAYKLIESLQDLGILVEVTGAERNRIYVFQDYLKLFTS